MHLCIWHGYLLRGTGSNIYVRNVAAQAVVEGHRVSLFCQEDAPEMLEFVDRAYDLDGDNASLVPLYEREGSSEPRCTVYRPDLDGLLPVYVYDRYERFPDVVEMPEMTDRQIERYIVRNVQAMQTVFKEDAPDLVMTNHAVLSPEIARRALGDAVPRISILHGSALNYSVRNDERLHRLAVSGLEGSRAVVVGSPEAADTAAEVMAGKLAELEHTMKVVPCGVDTDLFRPWDTDEAMAGLRDALQGETGLSVDSEREIAERLLQARGADAIAASVDASRGSYDERLPDQGALAKLEALEPERPGLAVYTGKLIVSKGVQALLLALPEFLAGNDARVAIVGFGTCREGLQVLLDGLARGDGATLRAVADLGWRLEGGDSAPLPEMTAFLDDLERRGALEDYLERSRNCDLARRVSFIGILEHPALSRLLAMADLAVAPSIFPESFGMVGVEAMACGVLPVMTDKGGLADLIGTIGEDAGGEVASAIAVEPAPDRMVRSLVRALSSSYDLVRNRPELRDRLREIACERFGWAPVFRRLVSLGS